MTFFGLWANPGGFQGLHLIQCPNTTLGGIQDAVLGLKPGVLTTKDKLQLLD